MFPSFRRRLTVVALAVFLLFTFGLVGIQTTPSGSQTMKPSVSLFQQTHNPTCGSAFNTSVCAWAYPNGIKIRWWGKGFTLWTHNTLCGIGCGSETYSIDGVWTYANYDGGMYWHNAASHSVFIKINKPDIYDGNLSLSRLAGGYGKTVEFRLVVPQVGTSNLAVTTNSLPDYRVGAKYLARLSASGGKPPYSWIRLPVSVITGLTLTRAGIITGIARLAHATWFPVIVRDEVGHSAYALLSITPAA
jgi:hypothetical protein